MTHDTHLRLNTQISEEAAEWFVEFRTGDVDDAGRRAFDIWVRSSQEHLRAYLEFAAIWNECDGLDAQREWNTATLIGLADENVVQLADVRQPQASVVSTPSPDRRRVRSVAIAASVAFLVCTSAALLWSQVFRWPTYATEVGEQRSIRLEDGSTVELNSRSRVRVSYMADERRVELLEGQALFHVAKNSARPFIVRSGDTRVRAVGTRFDVNKKRTGTVVTVVEGKVAVVNAAGAGPEATQLSTSSAAGSSDSAPPSTGDTIAAPILLSAGEQLAVTTMQVTPQPMRVNATAATAWTQRQLVVESAPLAEVAEEFNRYSARKLVVHDSPDNELRLSGVFETDPDFLIRYLRARSDITVSETETQIIIQRHD